MTYKLYDTIYTPVSGTFAFFLKVMPVVTILRSQCPRTICHFCREKNMIEKSAQQFTKLLLRLNMYYLLMYEVFKLIVKFVIYSNKLHKD
jgi:hypothetical protein